MKWTPTSTIRSRVDELNRSKPFVHGDRKRDLNNLGPRLGFSSFAASPSTTPRGGYGTYYDRIVLQIQSPNVASTAARCRWKCGRAIFTTWINRRDASRRSHQRQSVPEVHPSGRRCFGHPASSIRTCRAPPSTSSTSGSISELPAHSFVWMPCSGARTSSSGARSAKCSTRLSADQTAWSTSSRVRRRKLRRTARQPRPQLRQRPRRSSGLPLSESLELRQRRSDSVLERSDRSEQPGARTGPTPTDRRHRLVLSGRTAARASGAVRLVDRLVRRADGHPDARRPVAHSDDSA